MQKIGRWLSCLVGLIFFFSLKFVLKWKKQSSCSRFMFRKPSSVMGLIVVVGIVVVQFVEFFFLLFFLSLRRNNGRGCFGNVVPG